jgi:hypothetical protein
VEDGDRKSNLCFSHDMPQSQLQSFSGVMTRCAHR